jgi:hypothetical protein
MRKALLAAGAALALMGGNAHAAVFTNHQSDITRDFVPGSPLDPNAHADLDFTDLAVTFNEEGNAFMVSVTLNGDLSLNPDGAYVIGIDTGAGAHHPFGGVGEANILFDQSMTIGKDGLAMLTKPQDKGGGFQQLTATLAHNGFTIAIPLDQLEATGLNPRNFGFSAWSKSGAVLADFVPNNKLLTAAGVPEPATWAMLVGGFALMGGTLRRRRASSARLLAV